jgi:hypothetical protein
MQYTTVPRLASADSVLLLDVAINAEFTVLTTKLWVREFGVGDVVTETYEDNLAEGSTTITEM